MDTVIRPAWVEIDVAALRQNIRNIMQKAAPRQVVGVIKADGYGHGSVKCAELLAEEGVKTFAVATLEEVEALRNAGFTQRILVLGLVQPEFAEPAVRLDATPAVCSLAAAEAISAAAGRLSKKAEVLIACDTGMGRIGYQPEDKALAAKEIRAMKALPNLSVYGMFSHLSTADCADKTYTLLQNSRFQEFADYLKANDANPGLVMLANSAAIMEVPQVKYDAVRAGIILYGLYPSDEVKPEELALTPAMSVKAKVVHLKTIPAGASVGYGRKFIAQRPTRIATFPVGYADGFPRPYSAFGHVLLNGHVAPIAGNICMDQFMADVTDIPDVKLGDTAILMGTDGVHTISAEEIAGKTGTINYEIVCAFGQRLPKKYV